MTGTAVDYTDAQLAEILSPRHFVEIRTTHGGPAPSETARATGVSETVLACDDEWLRETRDHLVRAAARLKTAAAQL